ncbi:MAG: hypothetical protein EP330_01950 [Deltaproteobacteria bacterium]|nr:MAG: hypothetical protein EP330_01950 [Deltaproteobacteria bacterium]
MAHLIALPLTLCFLLPVIFAPVAAFGSGLVLTLKERSDAGWWLFAAAPTLIGVWAMVLLAAVFGVFGIGITLALAMTLVGNAMCCEGAHRTQTFPGHPGGVYLLGVFIGIGVPALGWCMLEGRAPDVVMLLMALGTWAGGVWMCCGGVLLGIVGALRASSRVDPDSRDWT